MATYASRAPLRPRYRPWDRERTDHLFGALRLLALGSGLLLAAMYLVI